MSKNVKLAKRVLSVILCMALLFGELPPLGQKALAGELAPVADTHTHCICGETTCSGEGHNASQMWTDGTSLPSEAGYYYLGTDVTLSSAWKPANGTYLCLNGHVVKTISGRVIEIDYENSFTLTDCDTITIHRFAVNEDGLWVLDEVNGTNIVKGGVLTGAVSPFGGGGVYVSSGSFTMNGGNIVGNSASNNRHGGGIIVFESGTCILNDGRIIGNTAKYGGGIYVVGDLTINGGQVCNNIAEIGGGVYNYGYITMNHGRICNNVAHISGGGIYARTYNGLTLSGTPVVCDNVVGGTIANGVHSGGSANNVYLYYTNGSLFALNVNGGLKAGASVGISAGGSGIFAKRLNVSSLASSAEYFFNDTEDYAISVYNAELKLSRMYKVTFEKGAEDSIGAMEPVRVLAGSTYTLPACAFSRKGYEFVGWAVGQGGFVIQESSLVIEDDITLCATWEPLFLTGTVDIQGTLKYGETLTATVHNTNNTGTLIYQWIGGGADTYSEENTYVVKTEDIGSPITCVVYSTEQRGEIYTRTDSVVKGLDFSPVDIVVNGYNGSYDGQGHQILVSAPVGAYITYMYIRKRSLYRSESCI